MNKKLIITLAVVLVLLLGGGVFLMSTKNKPQTPTTTNNQGTVTQETSKSAPKSLKEIILAGVPQKCSFKDVSSSYDVEGTNYVAGGKMRGDFKTTAEGKTTNGHMIYDGKVSYVWTDESNQGFKMEISQESTTGTQSSSQQGLDMNKAIDYKCGVWVSDSSMFTPPSNVEFTEFKAPSSTGSGTTQTQNLCSSCNSLSGEQKTQCLAALNCN